MSVQTDDHFPATLSLRCGPIAALDLALYAAASGDHNPLHLDADVAHDAGFDQPVVHGMLSMAHAGRLFTNTFGPTALRSLDTRFTGAVLRGAVLVFTAERVPAQAGDEGLRYSLRGCSEAGTEFLLGSAVVAA